MPIVYPPKTINKTKTKVKKRKKGTVTEQMEGCAGGSSVHMFAIYTYCRMIHVSLLPGATLCENGR